MEGVQRKMADSQKESGSKEITKIANDYGNEDVKEHRDPGFCLPSAKRAYWVTLELCILSLSHTHPRIIVV